MRIMVDTNVLISAILFPRSTMNYLIEKVITNHTLVLCSFILEEINELFARKFYDKIPFLNEFLKNFSYELVCNPEKIDTDYYHYIRDISDLPILVSAINSKVDMIITGDKDFLSVNTDDKEIPLIMSPREFLDNFS